MEYLYLYEKKNTFVSSAKIINSKPFDTLHKSLMLSQIKEGLCTASYLLPKRKVARVLSS